MKKILLVVALFTLPVTLSGQSRAKNVILFLADAGGTSTIAAASLHGHGAPQKLFIQRMPHIGLSDTSSAGHIVTDSAAGMTAIVTGYKTQNGVISQSASAVRGKQDGAPLKTILEYAEERGLSTGVISNDSLTGATPAATYAHVNDRGKTAEIFMQAFTPRFGDGVDVMIGGVRPNIVKALAEAGTDLETLSQKYKRPILSSIAEVPADATRAIVLLESSAFDLEEALRTAMRILSKNRKGYFLMVEADVHTDRLRRGLDRMLEMDKVVATAAKLASRDTLLLFTADHSFDVRLRGGRFGEALLAGLEEAEAAAKAENRRDLRIPAVRVDNGHTGEEVLVAAQGPGAERVRGYMANTDIFHVMLRAFGWKPSPAAEAADTRN
ncbi:MAG TPA: alkaline phosphatase [Vicinamibacterales bacterium]